MSSLEAMLTERIERTISVPVAPQVNQFAQILADDVGAQAVLFYGSNLRTGALDGVLDFYCLLPGRQRERIWPRVSYHERVIGGMVLRAKLAVMAQETFARAAAGELFDTTIWARFVQPSALLWCADTAVRNQLVAALGEAAQTAARLAAALGPVQGDEDSYWRALFQATYRAEFRVEKPGREDSILSLNRAHFDGFLPVALEAQGIACEQLPDGLMPQIMPARRSAVLRWWHSRQRWGKSLNALRLIKASTTFEGAARYAAWKIERHTGMQVEITPWRERHPLLAAPAVLWQLWRWRSGSKKPDAG